MKSRGIKDNYEFIQRFINGDKQSILIVKKWIESIVMNHYWGLENEREDITQDVIVKVYLNLRNNNFKYNSSLKTYISRITKYTCIDYFRKRYKTEKINSDTIEISDKTDIQDEIINNERIALMEMIINELPEKCRKILKLALVEKLTYKHIGNLLGIAEGTVKSRVSRCIKEAVIIRKKNWNDT